MQFQNQDLQPSGSMSLGQQLLRWEWLVMAILLPVALVPRPQLLPILGLIPLFWLIRKFTYKRFFPRSYFTVPLVVIGLMILVSMWATPDLEFSLGKIVGLFYGMALFFAVTHAARQSRGALQIGIIALYLAQLLVVTVSLVGTNWARKLPYLSIITTRLPEIPIPGAESGFNPNQVAGVLLWITPLALAIAVGFLWRSTKLHRKLSLGVYFGIVTLTSLLALLFTGMLVLTQSRGGVLGLILSIFVMTFIAAGKRRWVFLFVTIGVGLMGLFVLTQQDNSFVTMIFPEANDTIESLSAGANSLEGRVEIWSRAIYGIQDFPFTGMGMNMFRRIVHILYPLFTIAPSVDLGHAHNHLLQTALDLGIPGLIAYMALWIGSGVMIWQIWQRGDYYMRTIAVGIAGSLSAYFVYGILDAVSLGAKPGFIFWLLLAILAAAHSLTLRESGKLPAKRKRSKNDIPEGDVILKRSKSRNHPA